MNNLLNIKSYWKFLQKNKVYTLIDVFGFSVSLAFVILIGIYTWQELSVDRFHEHGDEIYLLGSEDRYELAYPLGYRIQERYPEVEAVCPMVCSTMQGFPLEIGDKLFTATMNFADTTFFSFFSFPLHSGTKQNALDGRNAVISESFANKAFPGKSPIGESFKINDSLTVTVSAVMKDIKQSLIPYADLLIGIENVHYLNPTLTRDQLNNAGSSVVFLKTKQGEALQAKTGEMAEWFKEFFWPYNRNMLKQVLLTPLHDFYFGEEAQTWTLRKGDRDFVLVLLSVAIVILIFAVINYVNLTVAQTGFRAKEMATRRLLGSSRMELFLRLMMESTLLCLLSFGIALFIAFAVAPYAGDLLQSKLYLEETITPVSVVLSLLFVGVVGVVAGLLPAWIISNAKPIEVVRGSFRTKSKMVFSKFFITFQNIITIVMLACSLTMILQIDHMIHAPLGFNTHNIIDMSPWSLQRVDKLEAFVSELRRQACVVNVGFSQGSPLGGQNNASTTFQGQNISFQQFVADKAFCDIIGVEFIKDNAVVSGDGGWYINEEAIRQMGITGDEPSFTLDNGNRKISLLGVIKDFRLGNINRGLCPIMLQIKKTEEVDPWNLLIEIKGNPYEAMQTVSHIYEEMTGLSDFEGTFIDQQVQNSFESQRRMVKIIGLFTFIAVVISLLGLLAMSTYFIQQRTVEVSIRKVFGSTNGEILVKLISTFLTYVAIAFVIAIPIIWYFMTNWLSGYDYRISLSPLIYLAAGLFCFVISFATVFMQSWRAANRNPVESFRNLMR